MNRFERHTDVRELLQTKTQCEFKGAVYPTLEQNNARIARHCDELNGANLPTTQSIILLSGPSMG